MNFNNIYKSVFVIYKKPIYTLITLIIAILIIFLISWVSNIKLLKIIVFSSSFNLQQKLKIFVYSWEYLRLNFTAVNILILVLLSLLTGINISMTVYYFKNRITGIHTPRSGLIGTIIGMFGIGCSSCGSVILSSLIGISATTSIVGFLPLHGIEFGLLGILILLISIYTISQKIQNPQICKIK